MNTTLEASPFINPAFEAAIAANPDDYVFRAVYADWIEEQGTLPEVEERFINLWLRRDEPASRALAWAVSLSGEPYRSAGALMIASGDWLTNPATARPIHDLRLFQESHRRGTSNRFDTLSVIYANPEDINLLRNTAQIRSAFLHTYGGRQNIGESYPVLHGSGSINTLMEEMGLGQIQEHYGIVPGWLIWVPRPS